MCWKLTAAICINKHKKLNHYGLRYTICSYFFDPPIRDERYTCILERQIIGNSSQNVVLKV